MMMATATSLQLQNTSCTFVANSTDLVVDLVVINRMNSKNFLKAMNPFHY